MIRVESAVRTLHAFGQSLPCAIGRSGALPASDKREGDGMTPLGRWPIRTVLLRPDRVALPAGLRLPWRWIGPDDGWSDDPRDPAYNRAVRHPHRFSAERLWRDDGLYDVVVLLGHNDAPPEPGMGSAIFLHCWRDRQPTEGCVAVDRPALLDLVVRLSPGDTLEIV
ncbi:L,D-transpeptidase family protein [Flavisphingomonas formosensis]|uniref:L,D-transpeptidase family protein n=1 Tax=Flavisphingomonas formosensis TaxID=861534 RepID=UPI0012FC4C2C|nr:L,D-transpeptidase family protein [Sphingomonas formosensis]